MRDRAHRAPAMAHLESTALMATGVAALAQAPGLGTVVVGEGAKDDAPMLYGQTR